MTGNAADIHYCLEAISYFDRIADSLPAAGGAVGRLSLRMAALRPSLEGYLTSPALFTPDVLAGVAGLRTTLQDLCGYAEQLSRSAPADIDEAALAQFCARLQANEDILTFRKPEGDQSDLAAMQLPFESVSVDINQLIGHSTAGMLYAGSFRGQRVAVQVRECMEETQLLQLLQTSQHDGMLRCYGYASSGNQCRLVFELASYGSLARLLGSSIEALDLSLLLAWLLDVISTLTWLHGKGFVHGDVRPANMLLGEGFHVKLTAIGDPVGSGSVFSALDATVDSSSDVYAWAVSAINVLSRSQPSAGDLEAQAMHAVNSLLIDQEQEQELTRLLTDCLRYHPHIPSMSLRPSAGEVSGRLLSVLTAVGGDPRHDPHTTQKLEHAMQEAEAEQYSRQYEQPAEEVTSTHSLTLLEAAFQALPAITNTALAHECLEVIEEHFNASLKASLFQCSTLVETLRVHQDDLVLSALGLQALISLCLQPDNRSLLGTAGVFDVLFSIMQQHGTEDVAHNGCTAVCYLLHLPANRALAIAGIPVILQAMRLHAASAVVCERACDALWNLSVDAEGQSKLVQAGGIDAILSAMRSHIQHIGVAEAGCGALYVLSSNATHKAAIVKAGGVSIVIQLLINTSSEEVAKLGTGVLGNLATAAKNQQVIVESGGIAAVVGVMSEHLSNAAVMRNACRALANISTTTQYRSTIADGGGIQAVLQAMRCHANSVKVVEYSCKMLRSLAAVDALQAGIVECSGLEGIVDVMQSNMTVASVFEAGCGVIRNLSSHAEQKQRIGQAGAIEVVIQGMQTHIDASSAVEVAVETLKSLTKFFKNQTLIAKAGGIEALLSTANKYADRVTITEGCCDVLRLVSSNAHNRIYVAQAGGMDAIADVLRRCECN